LLEDVRKRVLKQIKPDEPFTPSVDHLYQIDPDLSINNAINHLKSVAVAGLACFPVAVDVVPVPTPT
jgi:hypothetical protein